MIQSFTIVNYLGETLYLDIRRPEDTGFLVDSVTGLNYPQTEISSQTYSTYDGSHFGGFHVEQRNIVMNIIFYEDNKEKLSIEDLRWKLMRYFIPKMELKFYATNEHDTFLIKGYIESCEINIFTKQEGAQISILCPDPNFVLQKENNSVPIGIIKPLFHFPVSIEYDSNMNEKTLEFGMVKQYPSTSINYEGSAVIGIVMKIEINTTTISNLRINNTTRGEYVIINDSKLKELIGNGIELNDEIIIDSRKGRKSATLVRNGITYNILNACLPVKSWPQLQNGTNVFTYTANDNVDRIKISITYETQFLGI